MSLGRWIKANAGCALMAILTACSGAARDSQAQKAVATFALTSDAQGFLCGRGQVSATLSIDSGLPSSIVVDCSANSVSGTLSDLSPETHTFSIEYFLEGVTIARVTAAAELHPGITTSLNFGAPQYFDSDGDGFTNLAELLTFGVFSLAWNDPTLRPLAETPRFSTNYVAVDYVGMAFAAGTSGSTHYQLTPDVGVIP